MRSESCYQFITDDAVQTNHGGGLDKSKNKQIIIF